MGESNDDRLTRIERLLGELTAQTTELHRLAIVARASGTAPPKRQKRRLAQKPTGKRR